MKKVALINNQPITTGVGRYAIMLYNSLINNVEIDHYFINRRMRSLYRISYGKSEVIHKARKKLLTDNPGLMKLKLSNLFLDYRFAKKIMDNYDLYHITNQNMALLNYYSNIGKNIITVHDISYYVIPVNQLQKILSKVVYIGLRKSDFIIAISNSTKNDLIKYFNIAEDKIRVIYHGIERFFKQIPHKYIDPVYTKYNLDKDYQYVLHIGKNIPRKNLFILVKAFQKLVNDFKMENVRLLKINSMNGKLIKNLGIERYVKTIDYIPEEDLPIVYNIADLFVFPSIYEGFGFPPLESMACGTPVITSNASSLPEVVGNAGIMLQPDDVDGFAEAMYEVLMNENLRKDMIKKGLEQAKKFSWDKCARETLEVYEKIV